MITDDLEKITERKFESAESGRILWLKLKEEYRTSELSQFILMPHEGEEYRQVIVEWIGEFAKRMNADQVILLGLVDEHQFSDSIKCEVQCHYRQIDENECAGLIDLYKMYEFTHNLQILSLKDPGGREMNFVNSGRLTFKEALRVVVLGIYEDYGEE